VHVLVLPVYASGICSHNSEVLGFYKVFALSNVLLFLYLLTCDDSVVSI